jgi:hypothetical protein
MLAHLTCPVADPWCTALCDTRPTHSWATHPPTHPLWLCLQELQREAITTALDACLLTDSEWQKLLAAGGCDKAPDGMADPLFDEEESEDAADSSKPDNTAG